jgi:signal transduction histidine kinase
MRRDLSRQDVGLQLDIDSDLPSVDLDEGQLKQALFNLIRNAREAIGSGGTVSISLRREAGGGIQLKIEDDGPGIEEAARSRLFEPFFTTKKHGTGLGLPITRQIVEAHAGTISCAARPEGGTCISIRLPPSKQVPYSETETEMLLESRSAQ